MQVIGLIIIPFILLCIGDNPKFPSCFKWLDNFDHWGDRDTSTYDAIIKSGFWARYNFIALRNPLNYFGYAVLGIQVTDTPIVVESNEHYTVGDSSGKESGFLYQDVDYGVHRVYEYYYIYKFSPTKCFRFRMGYKIGDPKSNKIGSYIEQVLVIQPYKSYTGE